MFAELALRGTRIGGRAAQFFPENLYNGANVTAIRRHLFENTELSGLVAFENTRKIWFDIDTRQKFCLYIARPGGKTDSFGAAFGVNSIEKLAALSSGFPINMPVSLIEEFSPDALAIAEIAHPADIEVSRKIYARFSKFGSEDSNLAMRRYMRELDMGNDREDFGNDPDGLPLYEGRMVDAFDHRAKAYVSGRGALRSGWIWLLAIRRRASDRSGGCAKLPCLKKSSKDSIASGLDFAMLRVQ
jgi:hypothetical protein